MPALVRIQLGCQVSPKNKVVDLTKSVLLLKHLTDGGRFGVFVAIQVGLVLPIMPFMPSAQL